MVPPQSLLSIGMFFEKTDANAEIGMLYLPLKSIQSVDEDIMCDFTTAEDTHSFIANGFVTHNCPNETPEGLNCVLPNTLVTLPGGSTRAIGSFLINDDWNKQQVVSIDWNPDGSGSKHAKNCSASRFIRNPIKEGTQLYRIMTKMDREVYATGDHPFYYKSDTGGKCRIDAKDLRIGHKVAVLPASIQRPD
jgi:intein/homing endonuclease